jgi:hypothetical protein
MTTSDDLKQRIEAIETGYEFMLAYAAQGRQTDKGAAAGRNVREYLEKMAAALDGLSVVVDACASELDPALPKQGAAFFAAVDSDARIALAAIRLALAREDVSSQLVDNMNASIHLRALLTDLFVVDEVLKPPKAP